MTENVPFSVSFACETDLLRKSPGGWRAQPRRGPARAPRYARGSLETSFLRIFIFHMKTLGAAERAASAASRGAADPFALPRDGRIAQHALFSKKKVGGVTPREAGAACPARGRQRRENASFRFKRSLKSTYFIG